MDEPEVEEEVPEADEEPEDEEEVPEPVDDVAKDADYVEEKPADKEQSGKRKRVKVEEHFVLDDSLGEVVGYDDPAFKGVPLVNIEGVDVMFTAFQCRFCESISTATNKVHCAFPVNQTSFSCFQCKLNHGGSKDGARGCSAVPQLRAMRRKAALRLQNKEDYTSAEFWTALESKTKVVDVEAIVESSVAADLKRKEEEKNSPKKARASPKKKKAASAAKECGGKPSGSKKKKGGGGGDGDDTAAAEQVTV